MDLFEVNNGIAFPSIHALIIEPFKGIWEADTDSGKGKAIKVFTYIELMCSPKKSNPFFGYSEKIRSSKVKKEVFKDETYISTSFMIQGVIKYKELLNIASPSYSLLNAALKAKDSLTQFLETVDFEERTNGGAAVLKPKDITAALKEVGDVAKKLEALRYDVLNELADDRTKTRNQREIGMYEE